MQKIITLSTDRKQGLYDITSDVTEVIKSSKIQTGIVSVYARGSTAAIMSQENWDQSVQNDVVTLLNRMVPSGIWEHDRQDNNGDAHLKSGLIGASQTIPIIDGTQDLYYINQPHDKGFISPESSYSEGEIEKAIDALSDEFRIPFRMHIDGYKYKEIADELGLKIGTVKSRIFFTRQKLMLTLKDYVR